MSGYIIVISFLFQAVNAGIIEPWKPWKQDVWSQIPIQDQSHKFEVFEPDLSCDLIIKKDGYVIDDVATGYGGDAVYLKCDARCEGPGATPILAWYKEPSRIPIPSRRRRLTSYSRSSNRVQRLLIRFFLQKDVGFYTCRGWLGPTIGWTEKTIKLQMGCRHPMISCDGSRCLPSKYRCDGWRQCDDGLDEYRCGAEICDEFEFFCDGNCRLHSVKCDGVYDCFDGTDELGCQKPTTIELSSTSSYPPTSTSPALITTDTQGVIEPWKSCKQDVWMNQMPIQAQSHTLFEPDLSCDLIIKKNDYVIDDVATGCGGDAVYLKCDARCKGPGATLALAWYKEPSRIPIPSRSRRVMSYSRSSNRVQRLTIRVFLQKDVGFYTCRGWLGPAVGCAEKTIKLQMANSASVSASSRMFKKSTTEETITCYDYDFDNTTELTTSTTESTTTTEVTEPPTTSYPDCGGDLFMCDDGNCIPSSWHCDGVADCLSGEDEWGCWDVTTASTTTTTEQPTTTVFPDCGRNQFMCHDGRCIPSSWQCDDIADCTAGEDEWGCWDEPTGSLMLFTGKQL